MFCIYGGTKSRKWGPFTDSVCSSNSQGSDPGISHSRSIQSDRKHVAELKLKLYEVLETSIKTLDLITSRKSIIQMEHCDLYTHDQTTIFCISCYFWLQSQVHGEPHKDSQSSFKEQMIKCSKVFWNFSVKQGYRTGNTKLGNTISILMTLQSTYLSYLLWGLISCYFSCEILSI